MSFKLPTHLFLLTDTIEDVQAFIEKIPEKAIAFPVSVLRDCTTVPYYEAHRDKIHVYYGVLPDNYKTIDHSVSHYHLVFDNDMSHIDIYFPLYPRFFLNGKIVYITGGKQSGVHINPLETVFSSQWEPATTGEFGSAPYDNGG
jgi:hypothetical protein